MEIIIVGCGKVGYNLAKNLSSEKGVNVTIIDNADVFEKKFEPIDVMFIRGNGLNAKTLIEAGAKDADLIISVTNADESNILCCIVAKRLGTKNTIARVRDPEHALDLNKFWKETGVDMLINPELQTAREISRLLRFPTADNIDTFVGGRVELVSFKVSDAADFFVGKSVSEIFNRKKMDILLATVERDNNAFIPNGEMVFEKKDIIKVLGRPSNIMNFFTHIGKNTEKIKSAVIVGGSKITYYLVNLLNRHSSNTAIKIIELDKAKCEALSEAFPRCLIINADGTDEEILLSEDIDHTEAMVCLTDRDEENTIIALYSLQLGIRKVIVKINHINDNMVKNLGIGSIVCTKRITSDHIIRYVRGLADAHGKNIRTLYKIFDGEQEKIEAVEINAEAGSKCLNVPICNLRIRKGILVGCIVRNSNIIIPMGDSSIEAGDTVIIIAKNGNILKLDDILDRG